MRKFIITILLVFGVAFAFSQQLGLQKKATLTSTTTNVDSVNHKFYDTTGIGAGKMWIYDGSKWVVIDSSEVGGGGSFDASGIRDTTAAIGWWDDGSVVRLRTATDTVDIGTGTRQRFFNVFGKSYFSDTASHDKTAEFRQGHGQVVTLPSITLGTQTLKTGYARFFGETGTSYVDLEGPADVNSAKLIYLPDNSGTVALMADVEAVGDTAAAARDTIRTIIANSTGSGNVVRSSAPTIAFLYLAGDSDPTALLNITQGGEGGYVNFGNGGLRLTSGFAWLRGGVHFQFPATAGTAHQVLQLVNPATGETKWHDDSLGAGGSGITTLNTLTATTQTFATGTSGTDFGISSATSTHTFNLPTASATNRGALSTTDWTAFDAKVDFSDTTSILSYIKYLVTLKLNSSDTASFANQFALKADKATTMTVAASSPLASSAGAQDLSANRTWTITLPGAAVGTMAVKDSLSYLAGNGEWRRPVAGTNITLTQNDTGYVIAATGAGSGDISQVGNVASGAAFDGTAGDTLTFKGTSNGTFSWEDTFFKMDSPLELSNGTSASEIRLYEASAAGTEKIILRSPAAMSTDKVATFKATTGTVTVDEDSASWLSTKTDDLVKLDKAAFDDSLNQYKTNIETGSGYAPTVMNGAGDTLYRATFGGTMTFSQTTFTIDADTAKSGGNVMTYSDGLLKAPLADPVFTGSVQIPNGTNPTTDATGEIALDSDDSALETFDGTASRIIPSRQLANYVILFPDSVQTRTDDVQLAHFPAEVYPFGITIFYVAISASASCTDTHVIEEWSDAVGTSQGTVESIALSGASKAESTSIDDGAIAADAYLNINLDGTTDNINQLIITIGYYVNPGD